MKKTRTRLWSLLLTVAMLLTLLPTTALAADTLPEAVDGKIILENDVTLNEQYTIEGDITL